MKRFGIMSVWMVALLVVGGLAFPAPISTAEEPEHALPSPPVELIKSDAESVIFRVRVPDVTLEKVEAAGRSWDAVTIPGFPASDEAGSPQVPVKRVLLGIPLEADYGIKVTLGKSRSLEGQYELIPAPRPLPLLNTDPSAVEKPFWVPSAGGGEWAFVVDAACYAADSYYPSSVASVDDSGFIRNQRFLAIQVSPVQFNPVARELLLHEDILVELSFRYPHGDALGSRQSAGAFEQILASAILNYDSAREWRGKVTGHSQPATDTMVLDPAYKIMVGQEGIYEVTRAELEAAGVPVTSIDPATFKIYYLGTQVPIRVFETAGVLDSLWFYGEELNNKFTETNVYWLTYGGDDGLRMGSKSVPPVLPGTVPVSANYTTTLHLEDDRYYLPQVPWDAQADHWLWDYTYYPSPRPTVSLSTQVSAVVTDSYTPTLTAVMVGLTDWAANPDHCVNLYVNGNLVTGYTWDGAQEEQIVHALMPASFLVEGPNQVRVDGCATAADYDVIWHDRFDLEVRREYQADSDWLVFDVPRDGEQYELGGFSAGTVEIFDVSDVYSPTYLVDFTTTLSATEYIAAFHDPAAGLGDRYLAVTPAQLLSPSSILADEPSNLADPANQADYIVIAHESLVTGIQPLVAYREGQGLTVAVVKLQDVFDEFSYGIYDPAAIKAFLAYAYAFWTSPEPTYVLLVGDGTYDYKNNLGTADPVLMPPYLAFVDPWIGETAADNKYVSVAGGDILPDMFIGRLPVVTLAQLQSVLAKTQAYETTPPTDGWNQRLLFTTDNPDDAGNFWQYSDDLVNNYVPDPYVASKAYTGLTCGGTVCRTQILNTLNSTSTLFINFIGHGGNQQWASEGILRVADLPSLVPNDRWPIALAMTCLEGFFHEVNKPSLGESFLRAASKGWVASWSPTGLGVAHGHDRLNKGFLRAVFYDGVRDLGLATYLGKLNLYQSGISLDQIDTYHLFGDPALHINALDADVQVAKTFAPAAVAPGGTLTYTLTFTNAGPATAHHVMLTDIVPAELMSPTVVYSSPEVLGQETGPDFTWSITNLLPHTGGEIQFTALVQPAIEPGTAIVNEAQISMAEPDLDPTNNVVSVTTTVRLLDLFVSKVGPDQVDVGQVLTYTISWGNLGGGVGPNTRLTDTLPSGLEYLGDNSGWSHTEPSPGLIVWEVQPNPLLGGASGAFVVTAQVSAELSAPVTLVNQVRIDSDAEDEDIANNQDQWSTEVQPVATRRFVYLPIVVKNLP